MFSEDYIKKVFKDGNQSQFYLFTTSGGINSSVNIILCDKFEACGVCKNCQILKNHSHPDLFYISGEEQSIKDQEVENLLSFIVTEGYSGKKVIAINNADRLTVRAQNRLLKMLEQPRENVYFLLETENPHILLETVVSRAIKVNLLSENNRSVAFLNENDLGNALLNGDYQKANEILSKIKSDKVNLVNKLLETSEYIRVKLPENQGEKDMIKSMNLIENLDKAIRNIESSGNLDLNLDILIYKS